jgi:hypothetical protein
LRGGQTVVTAHRHSVHRARRNVPSPAKRLGLRTRQALSHSNGFNNPSGTYSPTELSLTALTSA